MSKKSAFNTMVIPLACTIGALCLSTGSQATEGGGGAYANGGDGFMAGFFPPPGNYFRNYFLYYNADSYKDKDGKDAIPNFKVDVKAGVLKFFHMTDKTFLGGNWAIKVLVPIVSADVSAAGMHQSKTGLGDIVIDPFLLGYHAGNFHYTVGMDVYIPTGSYNKTNLANTSRNYWTFQPQFGATYFTDNGFELSGKVFYDINTKNDDTQYQSGDEFHFDYVIAKKIDALSFGLGGYFYKQVTDDEQNGVKVGADGNRGRIYGFGPMVKYDKNMFFSLKYQKESQARNKPEGYKFWFDFMYAF